MSVHKFDTARARKIANAVEMTPRQLLNIISEDFDSGAFNNPKGLLVLVIDENANGSLSLESYRAGVDRAQELGYMSMWHQRRIRSWEDG